MLSSCRKLRCLFLCWRCEVVLEPRKWQSLCLEQERSIHWRHRTLCFQAHVAFVSLSNPVSFHAYTCLEQRRIGFPFHSPGIHAGYLFRAIAWIYRCPNPLHRKDSCRTFASSCARCMQDLDCSKELFSRTLASDHQNKIGYSCRCMSRLLSLTY